MQDWRDLFAALNAGTDVEPEELDVFVLADVLRDAGADFSMVERKEIEWSNQLRESSPATEVMKQIWGDRWQKYESWCEKISEKGPFIGKKKAKGRGARQLLANLTGLVLGRVSMDWFVERTAERVKNGKYWATEKSMRPDREGYNMKIASVPPGSVKELWEKLAIGELPSV